MNTATIAPASALKRIPLSLIDPSPTQPRKKFTGIDEMAAGIKLHGIIQPPTVRPWPKRKDRFELVVGERRIRGAKQAGLTEVDVLVRELSDSEVVEIQIVENAQREDIHPLEEATAYETLHKKYGYSVEEIAAKVGKSTATVYARLKYSTLVPEAKKAFAEDRISAAIANMLVRIPHADLQLEAFKEITQYLYDDQLPTAREAADIIERDFMMMLGRAPFDTTDAELLPKTPACTTCPKRTGNQASLFDDASSKDLCTDPKCFKQKVDADWAKKADEAKKHKLPVLEGKKAQEALSHASAYVDLDAKNYDDRQQRTYRELLAKKKVEIPATLARDGEGAAHELVNKKDLQKIGVIEKKAQAAASSMDDSMKKQRAAEKKKKEKAAALTERIVEKAIKVGNAKTELAFARVVAAGVTRLVWHDTAAAVCRRREIDTGKPNDPRKALAKYAQAIDTLACRALVAELLCSDEENRNALADLFKVKA